MGADMRVPRAQGRAIGVAALGNALQHLFIEQGARDLAAEFLVKPRHQPAHLHTLGQRAAQKRRVRIRFLQIFADDP